MKYRQTKSSAKKRNNLKYVWFGIFTLCVSCFFHFQNAWGAQEELKSQIKELREIARKLESAAVQCRERIRSGKRSCNIRRGNDRFSIVEAENLAATLKHKADEIESFVSSYEIYDRGTFKGRGLNPDPDISQRYSYDCLGRCMDRLTFNVGACMAARPLYLGACTIKANIMYNKCKEENCRLR